MRKRVVILVVVLIAATAILAFNTLIDLLSSSIQDARIQDRTFSRIGVIVGPSSSGSDSSCTAMGDCILINKEVYIVYGGIDIAAHGENWCPHVAKSTDGGHSFVKLGKLFGPPYGYGMAQPESLFYENGWYYLFYHVNKEGHGYDSPNGWEIWAALSEDLVNWQQHQKVVSNIDVGLDKAITNPSVIKVGNYYYMTVSKRIEPKKYDIRLLKSQHLLDGWQYVKTILDPDKPEADWYQYGCWDSTLFRFYNQFVVLFGGRDEASLGLRNYGFAFTDDVEGNWSVMSSPFYVHTGGAGGRTGILLAEKSFKLYVDGNGWKEELQRYCWQIYAFQDSNETLLDPPNYRYAS